MFIDGAIVSTVNVVVKEDYGKKETFYSEPIIEEPDRCIQALYSLMRGHALIQGRTQMAPQICRW